MPIFPKCDNVAFFPLWQVLNEYETRGFEFLLQAFNTPDYLEDITGLTELQKETENAEVRYKKVFLRPISYFQQCFFYISSNVCLLNSLCNISWINYSLLKQCMVRSQNTSGFTNIKNTGFSFSNNNYFPCFPLLGVGAE